MLEQDMKYLSKYAIDPEIGRNFDSYEIPDFPFEMDLDPDMDDIELDEMDEDLWGDQQPVMPLPVFTVMPYNTILGVQILRKRELRNI